MSMYRVSLPLFVMPYFARVTCSIITRESNRYIADTTLRFQLLVRVTLFAVGLLSNSISNQWPRSTRVVDDCQLTLSCRTVIKHVVNTSARSLCLPISPAFMKSSQSILWHILTKIPMWLCHTSRAVISITLMLFLECLRVQVALLVLVSSSILYIIGIGWDILLSVIYMCFMHSVSV